MGAVLLMPDALTTACRIRARRRRQASERHTGQRVMASGICRGRHEICRVALKDTVIILAPNDETLIVLSLFHHLTSPMHLHPHANTCTRARANAPMHQRTNVPICQPSLLEFHKACARTHPSLRRRCQHAACHARCIFYARCQRGWTRCTRWTPSS